MFSRRCSSLQSPEEGKNTTERRKRRIRRIYYYLPDTRMAIGIWETSKIHSGIRGSSTCYVHFGVQGLSTNFAHFGAQGSSIS
jgi:hypothetical protein